MYVCICVCVRERERDMLYIHIYKHTLRNINTCVHIFTYIFSMYKGIYTHFVHTHMCKHTHTSIFAKFSENKKCVRLAVTLSLFVTNDLFMCS